MDRLDWYHGSIMLVALLVALLIGWVTFQYHETQRTYVKAGYEQSQKQGTTEVMWIKK